MVPLPPLSIAPPVISVRSAPLSITLSRAKRTTKENKQNPDSWMLKMQIGF
jgi:hypothetical protein